MTQADTLKMIERFKGYPISTTEVKEKLKVDSVIANLNKLEQQGLVKRIGRRRPLCDLWILIKPDIETPTKKKKTHQDALKSKFKAKDRYDEGLNEGFRLALDSISKLKRMFQ